LPGNSSGRGGSPGSSTGGGTSGRGLPGGASGGGSAGLPGVGGGISGGSIGIYIATLRWSTSRARSLAIVCSTVAAATTKPERRCSWIGRVEPGYSVAELPDMGLSYGLSSSVLLRVLPASA
jgi:hypothetical protein